MNTSDILSLIGEKLKSDFLNKKITYNQLEIACEIAKDLYRELSDGEIEAILHSLSKISPLISTYYITHLTSHPQDKSSDILRKISKLMQ